MNREILFRAKRVDNGEWVIGSLLQGITHDKECTIIVPKGELFSMIGTSFCEECNRHYDIDYEVHPETVGQFTGLLDKNGKRIFEGDIIEMSFNGGQVELRAQVKYSETECYYFLSGIAKDKGWTGHYGYGNPIFVFEKIFNLEIIGNIHDNKELLEVEE